MAQSHGDSDLTHVMSCHLQAVRSCVPVRQLSDNSLPCHAVGESLARKPRALVACRLCLVASCPGGVASNVVTFLARADVPLSVAMTMVSTLTAIVATPALAKLLVGKLVPVDAGSLLLSTLQARQLAPCVCIVPWASCC